MEVVGRGENQAVASSTVLREKMTQGEHRWEEKSGKGDQLQE
jgi:hypothetical protein